jgi:hypothetical protein
LKLNKEDINMKKKIFLVISIILVIISFTVGKDSESGNLLQKVDRNLNPESYESYKKLINIEPNGRKKEFVLFTVKKGKDKVAALFISPASEEGRSTLRMEENMWLFIPNIGKPVRITSLQSVVGGVFNNADILRLDYAEEYNIQKTEDQGMEILLHLKAKTKNFGNGIVRPSVIETISPLHKGYKSVMIFAGIKQRKFKDEVFTLSFMHNLESLR